MNRVLQLLLLLLVSSPCWATFTLVQVKQNSACAGVTCTVTVTSTGTQHAIVVAWALTAASAHISGVSGGGTYTLCGSACEVGNATTGYTDMAYTLSSTSGATSIILTATSSNGGVATVWEYSYTASSIAFDASGGSLVATNCTTTCAGVSLTLGGSNDAISIIASCGGACTALSGTGWVNDLADAGGDLAAHNINTASGTGPTITQSPTSNIATTAIAIKEVTGGGTVHPPLFVIQP